MLVLKTSPPFLRKIHSVCTRSQCAVHITCSHPGSGNGVTEGNPFPSKSREEARLRTLDEALGPLSQDGDMAPGMGGACIRLGVTLE